MLLLGKASLQLGTLLFCHRAHVGIVRRIVDERLGVFQLLCCFLIGLRRGDHWRQLRMLLGEFYKAVPRSAGRQLGFHRVKAVNQASDGVGGNHDAILPPLTGR